MMGILVAGKNGTGAVAALTSDLQNGDRERSLHEAVQVKPVLCWKHQDIEDAKEMEPTRSRAREVCCGSKEPSK